MSSADGHNPLDADRERIEKLWAVAVSPVDVSQTIEKAAFMGVNLRVDLLKSLQAAWETAKVAVETVAAAHVTFDPITWMMIGAEAAGAARTIVAALVQTMRPIDYITYVILSQKPNGTSEGDLSTEVQQFLAGENATRFAWYLGMDGARSRTAAETTKAPKWFETALKKLEENGMVERQDGHVRSMPRNFTIGWKSE